MKEILKTSVYIRCFWQLFRKDMSPALLNSLIFRRLGGKRGVKAFE